MLSRTEHRQVREVKQAFTPRATSTLLITLLTVVYCHIFSLTVNNMFTVNKM